MAKMNNVTNPANSELYLGLTAIGLTKTQARCYGLLQPYSLSAAQLALLLGASRPNIYGSLKDLRDKGFITELRIVAPIKYRMVPLPHALVAYAEYQHRQVGNLIVQQQADKA